MDTKKADELVDIKFKHIIKNNGSDDALLKEHPELGGFPGNCAYCEMHKIMIDTVSQGDCGKCILYGEEDYDSSKVGDNGIICCYGLFTDWITTETKASAEKLYNFILKKRAERDKN